MSNIKNKEDEEIKQKISELFSEVSSKKRKSWYDNKEVKKCSF